MSDGRAAHDPYGAVIEHHGVGKCVVEYGGLEAEDFVNRGTANLERGYGCVPIGRVDPNRPDQPPHKVAWCRGYHGYGAQNAAAAEIAAMPKKIILRVAFGNERGLLNLGARLPVGMVGLDVDSYGNKSGLATIAQQEDRLGGRQPTYFVTARGFDSGSGIYLYRTSDDWAGVGVLGAGIETIQPHLRYVAAPGSMHHTGETYRLYHEGAGPQDLGFVLPALDDPYLAPFPEAWGHALYRRPRRRGTCPDIEDIEAVASEWVFDQHPYMLDATVLAVRDATEDGTTRNATHRALWIAARKARAGCYPFSRAVAEIEAAAVASYAKRGLELGLVDFARSIKHAVGEALDMSDAEVAAWGAWGGSDAVGNVRGRRSE